ncbi:exported protein of unknown function [Nitrosotalea devaniterrae]|uniref:Uncharacterized protein n=1 Tax=Nitrosotalea devaniterrae TaxID=1078905 RepID=A0A128A3W9_9ARCH|nr:exported protein of unknown function [Candidatus Nitrosotalea devanaterra]
MKTVTIALLIVSVAIFGIFLFLETFKPAPTAVIQLSATAETSPGNVRVHTLQQLADIDSNTVILDNSTLDKIPVLKNAIDHAFSKFEPPPLHGVHTFTTDISQGDADAILQLAGDKAEQLPELQTNDTNFGVNFTTDTSTMEFKLDNFYYHVIIEQLVPLP